MAGLNKLRIVLLTAMVLVFFVAPSFADNITGGQWGDQIYIWNENQGWINVAYTDNSGPGDPAEYGLNVSDTNVTGWMWGENIGWIAMSCAEIPGTCDFASYSVTNDGYGNLKGYAWGENVGWISFSCENDDSCDGGMNQWGVVVDWKTGLFSGYAWAENIGWINFSCENTATCEANPFTIATSWSGDTDNDDIPDQFERDNAGLVVGVNDAGGDLDVDGLTNKEEWEHRTNPNEGDSDFDGMPDKYEVDNGLDPTFDDANEDADIDGSSNIWEYRDGTDPWDPYDFMLRFSITGAVVTDFVGHEVGMEMAQVALESTDYTTQTIGSGVFSFIEVLEGDYTLQVNKAGFATYTAAITLSGTDLDVGKIYLQFLPGDMDQDGVLSLADAELLLNQVAPDKIIAGPYVKGDMNDDGALSETDAELILNQVAPDRIITDPYIVGDMDGDGDVDLADILLDLQVLTNIRN